MSLIAVLVKRNRVNQQGPHSFKCFGGVLCTDVSVGQSFYTRRVTGQNPSVIQRHLMDIVNKRQEALC
jgi:hypothetical protein